MIKPRRTLSNSVRHARFEFLPWKRESFALDLDQGINIQKNFKDIDPRFSANFLQEQPFLRLPPRWLFPRWSLPGPGAGPCGSSSGPRRSSRSSLAEARGQKVAGMSKALASRGQVELFGEQPTREATVFLSPSSAPFLPSFSLALCPLPSSLRRARGLPGWPRRAPLGWQCCEERPDGPIYPRGSCDGPVSPRPTEPTGSRWKKGSVAKARSSLSWSRVASSNAGFLRA